MSSPWNYVGFVEVQFKNEITFICYFSLVLSHIVDCKPNLNSKVQETK